VYIYICWFPAKEIRFVLCTEHCSWSSAEGVSSEIKAEDTLSLRHVSSCDVTRAVAM
jgi:hypothetical protein